MVTVGEYVERASAVFDGAELFYGHGTDNAFDEAVYLVFATLDIAFDDPEAYSRVIARDECDLLDSRVADRVEKHTHRLLIWLVRRGLAACALLRMRAR